MGRHAVAAMTFRRFDSDRSASGMDVLSQLVRSPEPKPQANGHAAASGLMTINPQDHAYTPRPGRKV